MQVILRKLLHRLLFIQIKIILMSGHNITIRKLFLHHKALKQKLTSNLQRPKKKKKKVKKFQKFSVSTDTNSVRSQKILMPIADRFTIEQVILALKSLRLYLEIG